MSSSDIAKSPIRTGTNLIPSVNSGTPNSYLSTPVAKCTPIVDTKTPIAPAIKFLIDDFPLIAANIDKANNVSPKYSTGPNLRAISASSGVANKNIIIAKIPPKTLQIAAKPRALPGSPFFAIMYPSKAVATAGGAPGALINIAVMEPPKVPAQYRAAIIEIDATGSRLIVNGISKAIAIGELSPGKAPTNTPIKTPPKIKAKFCTSINN